MRGQVSFEFVIVMAVVLLLSAMIAADVFAESNDTFVLTASKTAALAELAKSGCAGSYLSSAKLVGKAVVLTVGGSCRPSASSVADYVEENICHSTPNHDASITCGGDVYTVMV